MDNVNKISKIDTSLNDSAYRGSQNDNKVERNKVEKVSFSDIYDIRQLSAQMNKSSSEFKLESVEEVNRELKNVIRNLDGEKADNLVDAFPSEDIIELAKMMWKTTN
ncbi:MAG: hypothetical protein SPF17_02905 [Candidatus Mucispirillum faecigallinarum]|nr:hypothetical protein [Candidatus Mucispirillum faecigallinarum]